MSAKTTGMQGAGGLKFSMLVARSVLVVEAELDSDLDASRGMMCACTGKASQTKTCFGNYLNASHRACDHRWLHKPSTRQTRNKRIYPKILCMEKEAQVCTEGSV